MAHIDEVKKELARSVELTLPDGSVIRVSPETAGKVRSALAYAKLWEEEGSKLHQKYIEKKIKL